MWKCFLRVPIPQHSSKEITPVPWCNCQPSLALFSSFHVSLSICLSCLFSFCFLSELLPPATFILQSCHFCVLSISFISFARVMSSLHLSFCLFLFVLQSKCQVLPLYLLLFIPHSPLLSGFYICFSLSLSDPVFFCSDQFQCLWDDALLFKF